MTFGDPKVIILWASEKSCKTWPGFTCAKLTQPSPQTKWRTDTFILFPGLGAGKSGTASNLHYSKWCHFKSRVHAIPLLSFESSGIGRGWGTITEMLRGLLAHLQVLDVVLGERMESKCQRTAL